MSRTRRHISEAVQLRADTRHHRNVPEEMGIYRGEVLTIMEALADIRVTLDHVEQLLEEDDEAEED